jgi:molecular chaperone DnaK (HSP70)
MSDGPAIIPNSLGERLTPSIVGLEPEGNLVLGQAARSCKSFTQSTSAAE